jgi:hypothetical protein
MELGSIDAAVAALRAANEAVAALAVERLTTAETTMVLDEIQTLRCQLPSHDDALLTHLQTETTPKELGAKNWNQVLATRWRISTSEAGRRLHDAALFGPRHTVSGGSLDPALPATAMGRSFGVINAEHVTVIREAMDRIPASVDAITRAQMEIDWARKAVGIGPKQLKDDINRTLFLLDQDGPEPDDDERQRKRGITKSPQLPDTMIQLKAVLTPQAWAMLEAIFATWAAPGMCNPADENPCTSGTPGQAQIDNDHRSVAQRQHDAFEQICRWVLQSGVLGQRNGVVATILVRTTLQDIESRAGVGVTGGGTIIPIRDLLTLAARNTTAHYLGIFDRATGSAMDLFRSRRTASVAQRLMLILRDGGCTKPGCTVPAYGTQVHHAARDWADDGQTNVDELGLACGPDNRAVGPNGWTTRLNDQHDVEWIPPPDLDTGQSRINDYHRPERLYKPPEDAPAPHGAPVDVAPSEVDQQAPWNTHTAWHNPARDEPETCDAGDTRRREPFVTRLCTRVPHHPRVTVPEVPEAPATRTPGRQRPPPRGPTPPRGA